MINYIGGKYKMADWISEYIPTKFDTYVEVFGGAYWVYVKGDVNKKFGLQKVIYNDFNRFMVNLFECFRKEEFRQLVCKTKSFDEEFFYESKKIVFEELNMDNIKLGDNDLALRYCYIMTHIFSGSKPEKSKYQYDYQDKFSSLRNRCSNLKIIEKLDKITKCENLDYSLIIPKYDSPNTFFYVDPPYWKTENYYSKHEFDRNDHEKLCNLLKDIKGKFALSYYDFPLLGDWLPKDKYNWEARNYAKSASAKEGKKQNKGTEILILNYKPPQLSLFNLSVGKNWTEEEKQKDKNKIK